MKDLLMEVETKNMPIHELKKRVDEILGVSVVVNPISNLSKKAQIYVKLPKDTQEAIKQKIVEIENLMGSYI